MAMRILIAGLAKTGTTALFYLLRNSLTGPVIELFEPAVCPAMAGVTGKAVTLAKILIKPEVDTASFAGFDRKIVLVRDPRDRIVSKLLYSQFHAPNLWDAPSVRRVLETLQKKERRPTDVTLLEVFEVMQRAQGSSAGRADLAAEIAWDAAQFAAYLTDTPDALRYKYEDFVEGRYAALEALLGIPIKGTAEVPRHTSRVVRTRSHGDWRNWLTPEDVEFFRPRLEPFLEQHGYDADDWNLNDEPVIAPAHASGYVLRLIAEARTTNLPFRGFA